MLDAQADRKKMTAMNGTEFLRQLPKVDVHCHLEGAVRPGTFLDLADQHGVALERARHQHPYGFTTLREFFETYRLVCESMVTRDDFSRVIYETLQYAGEMGNLKYCEMFFSPTSHSLTYEGQIDGLIEGIRAAETDFDVSCRLIPAIDRERSPAAAVELVQRVAAYRKDEVVGIGMDYDEAVGPPAMFVEAYQLAARNGLHRTAHSSAVSGPAQNVATCVDVLGCERIDHGYNLVDDPALMARMRDQHVPFTCCWSMSTVIGKFQDHGREPAMVKWGESFENHPIRRMIDRGLFVSLHTDDPLMIGTHIGQEYVAAKEAMGLDYAKMTELCLDAIEATWLDNVDRRAMRGRFEQEIHALHKQTGGYPGQPEALFPAS